MFKLHDNRKTKVWQEACEEGKKLRTKEMVKQWLARGMRHQEIADLMEIPIDEVRRLAKHTSD